MLMLVQREDPGGDVVKHPVHTFEKVLSRHSGTAHDTPVVGLDAVQV